VIGRFGISNPRPFVVGDRPELIKASGNNAFTNAFEIPLGSVINARAAAQAVDHFRFNAREGQRLLIECVSTEIASRMDPTLVLFSGDGRELQRGHRGELLDFSPPEDGQYILHVHDFLFRGGDEYFYRLRVDSRPYIDFIFPPSGEPGRRAKFTLYGRNLPAAAPGKICTPGGKALERLEVEIEIPSPTNRVVARTATPSPASTGVEGFLYRRHTPAGLSNPVFISFATASVIAEQEPNDRPEQANPVAIPCEIVGQFYPAGDQDGIMVEAKKGEIYQVEVFSRRLGLQTDPFVLIQRVMKNDKGELKTSDVKELYDSDANIGGVQFKTASFDPDFRWEVKDDGTYRVLIRDLFNTSRDDPHLIYRLSLRKESPDFRLVALPVAPPPPNKDAKELKVWTPLIRRGEAIAIQVLALRRDNFGGAIDLSVDGLPDGVSASPARIEAGKNSATLFVSAEASVAEWAGSVRVLGKAKIGNAVEIREACGGTLIWNVGNPSEEAVRSQLTEDFVLAVCGAEPAPISVQPTEDKTWEIPAGGKLKLPLLVKRDPEFGAALNLKPVGPAALDSAKEFEVGAKATNVTFELDLSQHKLSPGLYTLHLQIDAKGKYRRASVEEEKTAREEAEAAKKQAAELAAAAQTAKEDLEAARNDGAATDEAKAAAESTAGTAAAKAKESEAKKEAAAQRAKDLAERVKLRDVTLRTYSLPMLLKVLESPKTAAK
jgi:hypothetical protein